MRKFYPPVKSVTMADQRTVWKVNFSGVDGKLLGSVSKSKAKNIEEATKIFLDKFSTKKKCLANSDIKVEGIQYKVTRPIENQIMRLMRPIILD
tara:strand:+ start:242 stop:523 length:282 start_codon:yes stop_codon:yes gene_type:complete